MLANISETAHYSGSPVCVGVPVLYEQCRTKFSKSDSVHAVYDCVYLYCAIQLHEVAFIYWHPVDHCKFEF